MLSQEALCGSHIVVKRRFRLLDDADVVAILDENVVDALPARTIRPGAVNQNYIPDMMVFVVLT